MHSRRPLAELHRSRQRRQRARNAIERTLLARLSSLVLLVTLPGSSLLIRAQGLLSTEDMGVTSHQLVSDRASNVIEIEEI